MPRLSLRLRRSRRQRLAANERARQIAAELAASSAEDEIVWTPEGRHVLRVRRGLPPRWAEPADVLALGSRHPGGLDSLGWEIAAPRPVGPGEVEIEVHAAGLNFRDMMWAMGLLPEEALIDGFAGPTFGLECAGIVRSVGSDVEGLAVGDRVMGFAPAALGTRVVTMADALAPIPPETSFAAAATIPVTFVTAIYALGHLAKLAARGARADPCRRRRRRARRDPVRQASRRGRDRHGRIGGEASVPAPGRRRSRSRFARSRLLPMRCARSPAGRASMSC